MPESSEAIRDFVPRDQNAVRDLILDGLRERWGEAYNPRANPDLDDIGTAYLARGAEVVVLEEDGLIVACGTLVAEAEGRGRIVRMSVDHRYRRRGLARQIVEELVRRARGRGMTEVVVATDTPWESAVALYRACGFTEVGRDRTDTHFVRCI